MSRVVCIVFDCLSFQKLTRLITEPSTARHRGHGAPAAAHLEFPTDWTPKMKVASCTPFDFPVSMKLQSFGTQTKGSGLGILWHHTIDTIKHFLHPLLFFSWHNSFSVQKAVEFGVALVGWSSLWTACAWNDLHSPTHVSEDHFPRFFLRLGAWFPMTSVVFADSEWNMFFHWILILMFPKRQTKTIFTPKNSGVVWFFTAAVRHTLDERASAPLQQHNNGCVFTPMWPILKTDHWQIIWLNRLCTIVIFVCSVCSTHLGPALKDQPFLSNWLSFRSEQLSRKSKSTLMCLSFFFITCNFICERKLKKKHYLLFNICGTKSLFCEFEQQSTFPFRVLCLKFNVLQRKWEINLKHRAVVDFCRVPHVSWEGAVVCTEWPSSSSDVKFWLFPDTKIWKTQKRTKERQTCSSHIWIWPFLFWCCSQRQKTASIRVYLLPICSMLNKKYELFKTRACYMYSQSWSVSVFPNIFFQTEEFFVHQMKWYDKESQTTINETRRYSHFSHTLSTTVFLKCVSQQKNFSFTRRNVWPRITDNWKQNNISHLTSKITAHFGWKSHADISTFLDKATFLWWETGVFLTESSIQFPLPPKETQISPLTPQNLLVLTYFPAISSVLNDLMAFPLTLLRTQSGELKGFSIIDTDGWGDFIRFAEFRSNEENITQKEMFACTHKSPPDNDNLEHICRTPGTSVLYTNKCLPKTPQKYTG